MRHWQRQRLSIHRSTYVFYLAILSADDQIWSVRSQPPSVGIKSKCSSVESQVGQCQPVPASSTDASVSLTEVTKRSIRCRRLGCTSAPSPPSHSWRIVSEGQGEDRSRIEWCVSLAPLWPHWQPCCFVHPLASRPWHVVLEEDWSRGDRQSSQVRFNDFPTWLPLYSWFKPSLWWESGWEGPELYFFQPTLHWNDIDIASDYVLLSAGAV